MPLTQKPTWLLESDKNGWLPLHEAVRAGKTESVSIILSLVEDKDHVNARMGTDKKKGNAMWIAEKMKKFDEAHPMIKVLKENGGVSTAAIPKDQTPLKFIGVFSTAFSPPTHIYTPPPPPTPHKTFFHTREVSYLVPLLYCPSSFYFLLLASWLPTFFCFC